jgi:hypothetical protein
MKFNLPLSTSACLLLLLLAPGAAPAQNAPNPPPPLALAPAVQPPALSPATGMPLQTDPWISPDWEDPTLTLTNVFYDGLPASEVARDLRKAFQDKFDILISPGRTDPSGNSSELDPGSEIIKLQLKNVTASEIFRAMNLLLETENSPVRWQLLVNGKRPLVLLRVIPELLPGVTHSPVAKQTMVYYVGDLIGNGGMTMQQIADTLTDVNKEGYGGDIYIGFHDATQLVIVKGTGDQLSLVHNTLDVLKQKIPKIDERKAEMEETKAALSSLSTFINSLSKKDKKSDEAKPGDGSK